jgi:hypothetical protein
MYVALFCSLYRSKLLPGVSVRFQSKATVNACIRLFLAHEFNKKAKFTVDEAYEGAS